MTIVLAILYFVVVVWLRYPKQTVGNLVKPEPTISFIEIPIVHLEYVPKATVKRTVAQMRKDVRDLGIKGSARLNKQQCLEILGT